MKYLRSMLVCIFLPGILLLACQNKEVQEPPLNKKEQKNELKSNERAITDTNSSQNVTEKQQNETTENIKQKSKDENTTNINQPASNISAHVVYLDHSIKDVAVTESGDEIIVTGKAQVFEGMFAYALYDGNKVLIKNNCTADNSDWGNFKITFKKELVTSNKTKLQLFDYSEKDGSKIIFVEISISTF